jgi:hypothetical protein
MRRWHPLLLPTLVVLGLSAAGCGGSPATTSGRVTLNGQPVEAGSISFLPAAGDGPASAAAIENGEYALPPERPLRSGTYRVEVNWLKPTGKKIPSADPGIMTDERQEVIPTKYNTQSKLTVEITSGANVHNFELKDP